MSALSQLFALRRRRPGFVALVALTLLILAAYPFVDWWLRPEIGSAYRYFDFGAFKGAVNRVQAGEELYQRADDGGFHGTFLYPPIVVLLFWPFDLLEQFGFDVPFRTAAGLWNLASLVALWVGLRAVADALGCELGRWEEIAGLWLLIGFYPVTLSMQLGQMGLFMGAVLSLSLAGLLYGEADSGLSRPRDLVPASISYPLSAVASLPLLRALSLPRSFSLPLLFSGSRSFPGSRSASESRAGTARALAGYASGALTGLAGFVKLAYAPVGAHLLADRERFVGAVAAGVALLLGSLLMFGIDVHLTYVEVLTWGADRGSGSRSPTTLLPPYYRPLHWLPNPQLLRFGGSAAVAAVALLAAFSPSKRVDRDVFALGVFAFPLLTPLAYTYYFVSVLPAVAVLVAGELDRDGAPAVPVVGFLLVHFHFHGLTFVVEHGESLFGPIEVFAPYWILQPGLLGNLLLFGLAFARVVEALRLPPTVRRRLA